MNYGKNNKKGLEGKSDSETRTVDTKTVHVTKSPYGEGVDRSLVTHVTCFLFVISQLPIFKFKIDKKDRSTSLSRMCILS